MRKHFLLSYIALGCLFLTFSFTGPITSSTSHTAYQSLGMKIDPTFRRLGFAPSLLIPHANGETLFPCQSNLNPQPALCYGPAQIQRAYGFDKLYQRNLTGKGRNIVIVAAYGSPTLARDYAYFNQTWKLAAAPLKIYTPFGVAGVNEQWAFETTLDAEWSHALAPEATIHVVVARSNEDQDINLALQYAVDHNLGDVLSLSFGELESCLKPELLVRQHAIFEQATKKGITVLAASGDSGAGLPGCQSSQLEKGVASPASDPLVTSIGGTRLYADAESGLYDHEEVWQERERSSGSGGGYSHAYKRPAFQEQVVSEVGRGVPDISLNASTVGGVIVFYSSPENRGEPTLFIAGGTSASTPEFAGFVALTVQAGGQRLGNLNAALYKLGKGPQTSLAFHDLDSGDNSIESPQIQGYEAVEGWDAVTGWGSPCVDVLLDLLKPNVS